MTAQQTFSEYIREWWKEQSPQTHHTDATLPAIASMCSKGSNIWLNHIWQIGGTCKNCGKPMPKAPRP